jgi:large subunit ribosomal protein L21
MERVQTTLQDEEVRTMFAVVEIQGKQYRVSAKDTVTVDRLPGNVGETVRFEKVLLISDGKSTTIGTPALTGHTVEAKVIEHPRSDKVIVFKKKRRKGYQVKRGHRQDYTTIRIEKVS